MGSPIQKTRSRSECDFSYPYGVCVYVVASHSVKGYEVCGAVTWT